MSKPSKRIIVAALEELITKQINETLEADESAKQIYDKFIGPVIEYSEYLRQRNESEKKVPFAETDASIIEACRTNRNGFCDCGTRGKCKLEPPKGLPKDFTVIHH